MSSPRRLETSRDPFTASAFFPADAAHLGALSYAELFRGVLEPAGCKLASESAGDVVLRVEVTGERRTVWLARTVRLCTDPPYALLGAEQRALLAMLNASLLKYLRQIPNAHEPHQTVPAGYSGYAATLAAGSLAQWRLAPDLPGAEEIDGGQDRA